MAGIEENAVADGGFAADRDAGHVADRARVGICHAFELMKKELSPLLPTGIYTIPEAACVGATEAELTAAGAVVTEADRPRDILSAKHDKNEVVVLYRKDYTPYEVIDRAALADLSNRGISFVALRGAIAGPSAINPKNRIYPSCFACSNAASAPLIWYSSKFLRIRR